MSQLPEKTQSAINHGREGMSVSEHGTFMADGPDAVQLYRLKVIQHSLDFEIRTGMKMSRFSALKAANEALGTNYRRKAHALEALNYVLGEES